MNAEITETIKGRMQILEFLAQRRFILAGCHNHSNPTNADKCKLKQALAWPVVPLESAGIGGVSHANKNGLEFYYF